MPSTAPGPGSEPVPITNPREPVELLFRQLRARPDGLSSREAERRLVSYGSNELVRRAVRQWPRELAKQVTHPLALLLWVAAGLAFLAGAPVLGAAIVAVVVLNAVFAFAQERQAERAIEALRAVSAPAGARAARRQAADGRGASVSSRATCSCSPRATGSRRTHACSQGSVEVDLSTLTGESQPVLRSAGPATRGRLVARSAPISSSAARRASVATRRRSSSRPACRPSSGGSPRSPSGVETEPSPLERQVRRVAWLIALVARRRRDRVPPDRLARRRTAARRTRSTSRSA